MVTPVVTMFALGTFICPRDKQPIKRDTYIAMNYLAGWHDDLPQGEELPDNSGGVLRDYYGGKFHMGGTGTETRVWSDGPDQKNGGGKVSVAKDLKSFEAAWETLYLPSFIESGQNCVRRLALAELLHVWGCFHGDIVWTVQTNGTLKVVN